MTGSLKKLNEQMSVAIRKHDDVAVLKLLDRHPLLVHQRSMIAYQGSWLHEAARYRRNILIGPLLERGLELDEKDSRGGTPLMAAIVANNADGVRALLSLGADPLTSNDLGQGAFHLAVGRGHLGVVQEMLPWIENVDAISFGVTALWTAVCDNNTDLTRMLLQIGADPEYRRADGMSILAAAELHDSKNTIALIRGWNFAALAEKAINSTQAVCLKPLALDIRY